MKCIQNEGRRMDGNARGQNEYGMLIDLSLINEKFVY